METSASHINPFVKNYFRNVFRNGNYFGMKIIVLIFLLSLFLSGCGMKPQPEPLPLSVNATLNLLQEDPQFVMYINFKSLRRSGFWQRNVSDSILNIEKTFGSMLNTFKLATGASISDGVDELFYSNSWFGENAIVLKGVFDRNKLNNYLTTDSIFSLAKNSGDKNIYIKNDNGLYFYFRDDFTICASNYLKQIDMMMQVQDTSISGLQLNRGVLDAIDRIIYKEDMWMVTTEKFFIRGIFQNFVEATSGKHFNEDSLSDNPDVLNDSAVAGEKLTIENLYKRLNSFSFSVKMTDNVSLLIQGECIDDESAKYLKSILNGVITVAKLSSSSKPGKLTSKTFDKLNLERYGNEVFIKVEVDESNMRELRSSGF